MKKDLMKKASKWLNDKASNNYMPVVNTVLGYAAFCAYVFRICREDKPSVVRDENG